MYLEKICFLKTYKGCDLRWQLITAQNARKAKELTD
jgi:hypothetical protein